MTGLEIYMKENDWTLTHGETTEWNTYTNCSRSWLHKDGSRLLIGLIGQPTRVGVILPMIYKDGELIEALPSSNFDEFLSFYCLSK